MNQKKKKDFCLHTYCNPLSLPELPRGTDDWMNATHGILGDTGKPENVTGPDYRSISDPTVFYENGKWYLYPSYGMAWVTSDFEHWEHKRTTPYNPKYSPTICRWRDKYLMTSWCCPLYVTDDPLGPFTELGDFMMPDGTPFVPGDPGIFADDDGRLYLYAVDCPPNPDTFEGFGLRIIGYELDVENPRQVVRGPVTLIDMDPVNKPWERHGLYGQEIDFGWCEGPHMLKHNGRYYLIYAAPDTCDASYCMAVYVSDVSPLDDFKPQKRNPLTFHRGGIVAGAGHGCVEHGSGNTLWAFFTIAAPYLHRYERRIGMDRVDVDENGELYCPIGVSDVPQYVPGVSPAKLTPDATPGALSLCAAVRPTASSSREGRDPVYATDENNLSFWQPADDDAEPWLECDLSGSFAVGALRVFWRDVGLDYAKGVLPAPVHYALQGYAHGAWFTILDKMDNTAEMNIAYDTFPAVPCEKVRLRFINERGGLRTGVIDFTVFGLSAKRMEDDA